MRTFWVKKAELKNRMFHIDKQNQITWKMRFEQKSILDNDEVAFFQVLFPPKPFSHWGRTQHRFKGSILNWNNETKEWDIDDDVLDIMISKADYDWFKLKTIKMGDRVRVTGKTYITQKYYARVEGLSWEVMKRGE